MKVYVVEYLRNDPPLKSGNIMKVFSTRTGAQAFIDKIVETMLEETKWNRYKVVSSMGIVEKDLIE